MKRLMTIVGLGAALLLPAQAAAATDSAAQAGIAQTAQSFDTLVFDANGDGLQDFLYSPQNGGPRQLWEQNAGGTFTKTTTMRYSVNTADQHGCSTGDYDHNGLPDIYCALGAIHGTRSKVNSLFMQLNPGQFTDQSQMYGSDDPNGRSYSTATLDANGDGWDDLFVDNYHPRPDGVPTPDRLFINLGADPVTGQWLGFRAAPEWGVDQEQGNRGCDLSHVDFNGDGRQDIVFCGTGRMYLYENMGDHFTDVTSQLLGSNLFAADATFADLNGDGRADLVFAVAGKAAYKPQRVDGTYGTAVTIRATTAGRTVAVGDLDGDGDPDVYVLQGNGQPGCTSCPTNLPDYIMANNGLGKFTQTDQTTATGSGDTSDLINVAGKNEVIVGNGANLIAGPVQLWSEP